MWGGDPLALHLRQKEGRSIIEFLSEFDLQLLLSRGTITYSKNSQGRTSTIDLIITKSRLFCAWIICQTHKTAYTSDHLTISTEFLIDPADIIVLPRRLYKNADWKALNIYVGDALSTLSNINPVTHLDLYTSKLIKIVLKRIEASIPVLKASLYNKRWWTKKLSSLRTKYTHVRNQSRS